MFYRFYVPISAFGKQIAQHPLHLGTLLRMEIDARGCTILLMELARQQGLDDVGEIGGDDKLLLRLMMPVAKMYTAKKAVENCSEGIECFGGQGYIEDTGIPGFLRDAQVLPIWEGTSNVMALDVLRALSKSKGESIRVFRKRVLSVIGSAAKSSDSNIDQASRNLQIAITNLIDFVSSNQDILEHAGRDFAISLANIYIAALLIEQALSTQNKIDAITARNWTITRELCLVNHGQKTNIYRLLKSKDSFDIVFENYDREDAIIP